MSFKDIVRGFVAAVIFFAAAWTFGFTVTVFGLTGWAAFGATVAIFSGLNFLTRKLIGKPDIPQIESRQGTLRSAAADPKWVVGRARIGGHLVFYEEWYHSKDNKPDSDPLNIRKEDRACRWIIVLSEGRLDGIERVWVNNHELHFNNNHGYGFAREGEIMTQDFQHSGLGNEWAFINEFRNRHAENGNLQFFTDEYNRMDGLANDWKWNANQNSHNKLFEPLFYCAMYYGGDSWEENYSHPYNESSHVLAGRSDTKWTNNHRLVGKTYLVCKAVQWGNRGKWVEQGGVRAGAQEVNVLARGIRIKTPGRTTPIWTENAAAIRYFWHTEILNRSEDDIDEEEYRQAYEVCNQRIRTPAVIYGTHLADSIINSTYGTNNNNVSEAAKMDLINEWNRRYTGGGNYLGNRKDELRYSINGVITGAEARGNPQQVENAFDVAWAGYVVEIGGKLKFRPGVSRTPILTIGDDAIVNTPPNLTIGPPIQNKATSVELDLLSSAYHGWGAHKLDRIRDEVAIDREEGADFVRNVGTLIYVCYPKTAQRLASIMLKQESEMRLINLSVSLLDGVDTGFPLHSRLIPSDRVSLNIPSLNLNGGIWRVQSINNGMDGTAIFGLAEEPRDLYQAVHNAPIGFAPGNLQYVNAPRVKDWLPTAASEFTYDTFIPTVELTLPSVVNGRRVQYGSVALTPENDRVGMNNNIDSSRIYPATIGNNDPVLSCLFAGTGDTGRILCTTAYTARYVEVVDNQIRPLSHWGSEDWNEWFVHNGNGYIAGPVFTEKNRLPTNAYYMGCLPGVWDPTLMDETAIRFADDFQTYESLGYSSIDNINQYILQGTLQGYDSPVGYQVSFRIANSTYHDVVVKLNMGYLFTTPIIRDLDPIIHA